MNNVHLLYLVWFDDNSAVGGETLIDCFEYRIDAEDKLRQYKRKREFKKLKPLYDHVYLEIRQKEVK